MSVVCELLKSVREECKFLGANSLPDDIIEKICQLCLENRITAEAFVASWIAFVATKNLPNSEPTIELLEQLNKDELSKESKKIKVEQEDVDVAELEDEPMDEDIDDDLQLLEAYGTPKIKAEVKKRQITPDSAFSKRRLGQKKSPIIFSPATTHSERASNTPNRNTYISRTNSGDVVASFGNSSDINWENKKIESPVIVHPYDEASTLTKKYRFMYEKLPLKALIQNQWLEDMGVHLQKFHDLSITPSSEMSMATKQTILGRVWSDGLGKLNLNQLYIECPLEGKTVTRVLLDVSSLKQFSFFPGQLIAVEGTNSQEKFIAEKVYDGLMLPFSQCLSNNKEMKEELQIVVASGPYMTTDKSYYKPLTDLISYLEKNQPHVCILLGPFLDSKCDDVFKFIEAQNSELCSLDDVFQSLIKTITDKINSDKTQLIIIPSLRDLHHNHFIYPTAPFSHPEVKGVHFMPDPCVLDINGVVVGITSADILFHLGKEELPSSGSTDRLGRLASHILKQKSFYPLCPPNEDVNIDYEHFDLYGSLPVTPDILILPSDFKHFIKNVNDCCCINPERLAKGVCGGTFARIHVKEHTRNPGSSIIDSISAQMLKI